jgi:hypothetical protein
LGRVRVSHGQGNILENIIFKWGEKNDWGSACWSDVFTSSVWKGTLSRECECVCGEVKSEFDVFASFDSWKKGELVLNIISVQLLRSRRGTMVNWRPYCHDRSDSSCPIPCSAVRISKTDDLEKAVLLDCLVNSADVSRYSNELIRKLCKVMFEQFLI